MPKPNAVQVSVGKSKVHGMNNINGLGLGLRREFLKDINKDEFLPDWWEIAPENWMNMPHHYREMFEEALRLRPTVAHGLSLSIGSHEPFDKEFLKNMKAFLDRNRIEHYSDHLSFTSLEGQQTYELLPVAMTKKNVEHIADRIKYVSDYMGRRLMLENSTYYYMPESDMREADFINAVMHKSGGKLLLDVNNIYVNGQNHGFDPYDFLDELDLDTAAYIHVAGHYHDKDLDLIIDSHGTSVKDEVWEFLAHTLRKVDIPVMIERDNHVPPYEVMQKEFKILEKIVQGAKDECKADSAVYS